MASLRGLDKATAKRRLFGYLKRRGFGFETIMKVVNEI
jgi:SOS response regulatory protein OraA/RecX